MKKIIITLLVCTLLIAGTATAFAQDEGETSELSEKIESLFDQYNPAEKQTYLDLKAEHTTFHEGREGIREETIQYYAGELSEISGQVADGTITPSEGKEKMDELKEAITALKEELSVIYEQKQAEAQAIRDELTALRDSIKEALSQEEIVASEVAAYLEELNDIFAKHLAMDYRYAEMVDEVLTD